MEVYYNETRSKLEREIAAIELDIDNPLQRIEVIIPLIVQCLSEMKEFVLKMGFNNKDNEIRFFKYQKPAIVAKLIFYNAIYKIEAKNPFGGKEVVENYLNKEMSELKRFYDRNIEFCKYYRTDSTYLDCKYFVRGQHDIKLSLDTVYFETDHRFSTSHDYKVAKIIANDRIQVYLEDQLHNYQNRKSFANSPLNWTGTKAAATELIYAVHSQGVFNNGNTDIITIVRFFENHFNIDLGDFYHTFLELKSRKMNRTKFLDSLRDALIKRMDEQDER
ncbi:RteC domain-containing protein [Chryseobacterium indologenes]|nr:RteC domain-containing protein [Chryseobacterium indologenes]MDM1555405.1 RteC domain-containing protein [Chryseobacterium indologenes]